MSDTKAAIADATHNPTLEEAILEILNGDLPRETLRQKAEFLLTQDLVQTVRKMQQDKQRQLLDVFNEV